MAGKPPRRRGRDEKPKGRPTLCRDCGKIFLTPKKDRTCPTCVKKE